MNKRPITTIIAGVLLLLLMAASFYFSFSSRSQGMLGVTMGPRIAGGTGDDPQSRIQRTPSQQRQANPGDNPRANAGNPPTGFQGLSVNSGINTVINTVTLVCNGLWMLAGLIGVVGLFLRRRWGITLAVLAAIGGIIILVPSLLPLFGGRTGFFMTPFLLVQLGSRLLLAIAVMVFALLPATRKACV
jgi:hypothetical protein